MGLTNHKSHLITILYCREISISQNDVYDEIQMANPEYVMGQECVEIQKTCIGAATTGVQKIQCWVQFGLCFGGKLLGCYKKCVPPLKDCQISAGRDWIKIFQCGADYIKCVTQTC